MVTEPPTQAPDGALIALPLADLHAYVDATMRHAQIEPIRCIERTVEDTVVDGAALNRMYDGWKAEMYAEFEGCSIVESMSRDPKEATSKFVAIAAYRDERKVLALWVAEAKTLRFHGGAQSISMTGKILPAPTDPEALPEPFRSLALAAFAQ